MVLLALLFSNILFAQTKSKTHVSNKHSTMTHCYAMKDGAMVKCMGSKGEPMAMDATLKNGTKVSTTGEVTWKNGKKETLTNGQAIDMNGKIGDFNKMHASVMKKEKSKAM